MFLQQKKLVLGGVILVLFLLLAACGSAGSESSNGNTGIGSTQDQGSTPSAPAAATITPLLITPRSSSGSPGKGPLVFSSPTPVPGGKAGSQRIVLGDRNLVINSVSKQQGASPNSTLINLDLTAHGSVIFRLVVEIQHRAGHRALATSPRVLRGAFAPPTVA